MKDLYSRNSEEPKNSDLWDCEADELLKVNKAYLWPRSKVWMRALKASIQTAATKVTNIGVRLSSGAFLWLWRGNSYLVAFSDKKC